jgi:hypothetical protein
MGTGLQFIPEIDPCIHQSSFRDHQSKKTPGIAGRFFS